MRGNNLISQDQTQGTQEITVQNVLCITNLADAIDFISNRLRVRILSISKFCKHVQTLGDNFKWVAISRIRFKFRLPFGQSYQLRRTQFPMRLALSLIHI